jgi:hypothetical protein
MINHGIVRNLETRSPRKKARPGVKFIKAPQAPKRFKSAYMFFSTAMHPEIRIRLGSKGAKEKVCNHLPVYPMYSEIVISLLVVMMPLTTGYTAVSMYGLYSAYIINIFISLSFY